MIKNQIYPTLLLYKKERKTNVFKILDQNIPEEQNEDELIDERCEENGIDEEEKG